MLGDAFDYATDTIIDTFDLDEKYARAIRLVLIVGAGWMALKFVKSIASRRD